MDAFFTLEATSYQDEISGFLGFIARWVAGSSACAIRILNARDGWKSLKDADSLQNWLSRETSFNKVLCAFKSGNLNLQQHQRDFEKCAFEFTVSPTSLRWDRIAPALTIDQLATKGKKVFKCRLWFDENRSLAKKSPAFLDWANSLLKWIRKNYTKDAAGHFVGRHAFELTKGGKLQLGPPK